MTPLITLDKPKVFTPYSTVLKDNNAEVVNPEHVLKVVFIPQGLTPLDVYEAELIKAGYSQTDVKEIIEGLKESPLYEGTAS